MDTSNIDANTSETKIADPVLAEYARLAADLGFTHSGPANVGALIPRDEVRDMCGADKCRSYGKSWSCPPACCTIEESKELIKKYHRGLIVQTVIKMRDDFDMKSILKGFPKHQDAFSKFTEKVKKSFPDCLPMGAGACNICRECTCPDEPCRFPDKMIISMEAYGLVVTEACKDSGIAYNYGPKTTAFISCILLD